MPWVAIDPPPEHPGMQVRETEDGHGALSLLEAIQRCPADLRAYVFGEEVPPEFPSEVPSDGHWS